MAYQLAVEAIRAKFGSPKTSYPVVKSNRLKTPKWVRPKTVRRR